MLEEADEDAPQETAPPRKPTTVLVERCTLSTSAFPARRVENLTEFAWDWRKGNCTRRHCKFRHEEKGGKSDPDKNGVPLQGGEANNVDACGSVEVNALVPVDYYKGQEHWLHAEWE